MSVSGIAYTNPAVSTYYQNMKKGSGEKTQEYDEGYLYAASAMAQNNMEQTKVKEEENEDKKSSEISNAWASAFQDMQGNAKYIESIGAYTNEGKIESGILGFGTLGDGTSYRALYDPSSTIADPVVEVRMEMGGERVMEIKVHVNQVNSANATQAELFALCSYADAQGLTSGEEFMSSYNGLLEQGKEAGKSVENVNEFVFGAKDWGYTVKEAGLGNMSEKVRSQKGTMGMSLVEQREQSRNRAPYSYLAKDGIIKYNGVTFVCDDEHRALRLGDTSNPKDCLNIPLSGGGSLIVNRDNIGSLAKAIGMFSPEDVNLIMRAIAQDAKIQQMQKEIDDTVSGIGEAGETDEETEDGDDLEAGIQAILADREEKEDI